MTLALATPPPAPPDPHTSATQRLDVVIAALVSLRGATSLADPRTVATLGELEHHTRRLAHQSGRLPGAVDQDGAP